MAKKESVLSQAEKDSFEIDAFIFHIIKKNEALPQYLEGVTLEEGQKLFFKERFSEVAEGVQHEFIDKDSGVTFNLYKTMMNCSDEVFLKTSKDLATDFKRLHGGNTSDGVFVISRVKLVENKRLIFCLKIDDKKVYQYDIKDAKASLREIINTFVEDKKAIQKSALIDTSGHYKWDVLAIDKNPTGITALTKYFSSFLEVRELDSPDSLTRKAVSAAKEWAIGHGNLLGLKYSPAEYKQKAIDYLNGAAKYSTTRFIEALIWEDLSILEDEKKRKEIQNSLKSHLDYKGLSGQSFIPKTNALTLREKRHVKQTREKVKIEFTGDLKSNNITISDKAADGYFTIQIKTTEILDL